MIERYGVVKLVKSWLLIQVKKTYYIIYFAMTQEKNAKNYSYSHTEQGDYPFTFSFHLMNLSLLKF